MAFERWRNLSNGGRVWRVGWVGALAVGSGCLYLSKTDQYIEYNTTPGQSYVTIRSDQPSTPSTQAASPSASNTLRPASYFTDANTNQKYLDALKSGGDKRCPDDPKYQVKSTDGASSLDLCLDVGDALIAPNGEIQFSPLKKNAQDASVNMVATLSDPTNAEACRISLGVLQKYAQYLLTQTNTIPASAHVPVSMVVNPGSQTDCDIHVMSN